MKKKILAALLAATMCVTTLGGCGSTSDSSESNESNKESSTAEVTASQETTSATAGTGKAPVYADTTAYDGLYSTVQKIADGDVTLNVMMAIRDSDNIIDPSEMPGVQRLSELTGLNLNFEIVKGSDWTTKTNLMFASGDMPDVIIAVNGEGQIDYEEYGVTQGLVLALDDYINEDYMPNYVARKNAEQSDPTQSLVASDGKTYSVGYLVGQNICEEGHYFINTEWLDELGLEVPTTVDELTEVLRAFKEAHPDGVPYEMGIDAGGYYNMKYVLPMFGLPNSDRWIYIDENKQVKFIPTDENFRAALEWLNMCYNEGLLDAEALSQDINTLQTKLVEGNVGYFSAWRLIAMGWDDGVAKNCECILPPSAEGTSAYMDRYVELAKPCGFVTSTCSNVEAAVRLLDSMLDTDMQYSLYYGEKDATDGSGWTYNADGKIESINDGSVTTKNYLDCNTMFFAPGEYISNVFVMPAQRIEKTQYCKDYDAAGVIGTYSSQYLSMAGLDAATLSDFKLVETDIDNAVSEYIADAIAHGVTDDSWNEFTAKFEKMNVDNYISTYQAAIDNMDLDALAGVK